MTGGNFDPFRRPDGTSEEVARHTAEEFLFAEDWGLRFSAHGAVYRALGEELATEQDPDKVMALAEQRQASLVSSLGAGVVSLWQRDVLAERQQFAAEFGE